MKRKIITSIFIVVLISACAATNGKLKGPMDKLDFIDTRTFDKNLSTAMRTQEEKIEVTPIVKFSPNEIPDRLGKWVSTIDEKGGEVVTENQSPKTKGLFGIGTGIDLALTLGKKIHDKILYKPAGKYDATIYYKSEEGLVEKIVFTRKID
jgi:hypothetical protein|tara:strand:+ start:94 stop:546 length:453 start_codon:yes stop_codon:yes gene_type:complete